MDLGFAKMPSRTRIVQPAPLRSSPASTLAAASPASQPASTAGVVATSTAAQRSMALLTSSRPMPRWMGRQSAIARGTESVASAIAEVNAELARTRSASVAGGPAPRPPARAVARPAATAIGSPSTFAVEALTPVARSEGALTADTRSEGDTGRSDWGVQLGAFRSKGDAERHLLTMALRDMPELNGGLRRIESAQLQGVTLFRAQFVGLSQTAAEAACATLVRERADCQTLSPGI